MIRPQSSLNEFITPNPCVLNWRPNAYTIRRTIKRLVATHWNSHVIMLQSMIHLHLVLDDLAATHAGLTVINVSEWEILTALKFVLWVGYYLIFIYQS